MTLLLDSGALIAMERGDAPSWERFKITIADGTPPITHGGVVAQVWRGGAGRQVLLARALAGTTIHPLDDHLGRLAGRLLAATELSDAIDAATVALARPGDRLATTDPDDLGPLVEASALDVTILRV